MPEQERLPICGGLGLSEQGTSCFKQGTGVLLNTANVRKGSRFPLHPYILPNGNRGIRLLTRVIL